MRVIRGSVIAATFVLALVGSAQSALSLFRLLRGRRQCRLHRPAYLLHVANWQ